MQQPAWRAEFRSLNRPPRRILHAVQKYAVLARGGGGGPGGAALDLDSEKEPLGPWRDSDVRVAFFLSFPPGTASLGPEFLFLTLKRESEQQRAQRLRRSARARRETACRAP